MKKIIRHIVYRVGQLTGWRWLSMMAGVALIVSSCSGQNSKNAEKKVKPQKPDSIQVTCYEPVSIESSKPQNPPVDERIGVTEVVKDTSKKNSNQ